MKAFPAVTKELLDRYNVPGPRYTSYPTVPEWTTSVGAGEYEARLSKARLRGPESPLSLYVHIPFCHEMCTYCGCNVIIAKDVSRADPYLDLLEREMDLVVARLGTRTRFAQLHFGGGTPTFLDEPRLRRVAKAVLDRFQPTPGAELAVEVDPVVTTRDQLALLAELGWNRLSMGVQDLDPVVQNAVNRIQSAETTEALIADARELGFRGINVDMIYGLPAQTPEGFQRTLERVLAMGPDRAAVYSFAYLPTLRPHQRRLDPTSVPTGLEKLQLFRIAYDAFVGAGYVPIGMDHFARPDDELARAQERRTLWRNFQGYTVKAATDAVAFGVTGIGDLEGAFFQNTRPMSHYAEAIEAGRFAIERGLILSEDDKRRREIITQLMCNFWVDLGDRAAALGPELEDLRALEGEGLVRRTGTEVELTALGRVFVRNVAMVFDSYLRRERQGAATPRFSSTV